MHVSMMPQESAGTGNKENTLHVRYSVLVILHVLYTVSQRALSC